jgi:CubicO group peptidase (beta-lactamase class C family)
MATRQIASALILAALVSSTALGEDIDTDADSLRTLVDELAQPAVEKGKTIGLVVGVITPDGKLVAGYGRLAADRDQPPDGDTLFEIGSITKVFTALCLAEMAESGKIGLDDPLDKHLPASVQFKVPPPRTITLKHLATHTSGLPRIPLVLAFADPGDPYAKFNEELLVQMLNGYEWPESAGTTFAYSNLGMGLLGWLLARRNETSYEDLVVERICKPLGLGDTRIVLSEDRLRRLAPGHTASGEPSGRWRFDVLAGAGAFHSTANDLLRFAAANLKTESNVPGPLAAAMARCRQTHFTNDSGPVVGLGWMIADRTPAGIWHNGGTGSYASFLGIVPDRGVAVVVLTNTSRSEDGSIADSVGGKLLGHLSR